MNWELIIQRYKINHRPRKEIEFDWFRQQPSFEDAVINASSARNERGKRYSHQARITRKCIKEAGNLLLEKCDELKSCSSFHDLWLLVRGILEPIHGAGELYIYDTSLRLGASLGLFPDRVYLHAGTRKGAKAFGLISDRGDWINQRELPGALRELPPYEVEDILCIYKDKSLSPNACT